MTKKKVSRIIFLCIAVAVIAAGMVFSHFGGFGTGKSANIEEFARYAQQIPEITIPENTRIVGFGEATHGNREFQQLKLDVFQIMVEKHGIRAFVLEGDFGGCEAVNRYIHGGEGTAQEAAEAIGFAIYRTEEMEKLITWMRSYNESTGEGKDLRFYGFDMQREEYNYQYLLEAAKSMNLDTARLEQLWDGDGLSDSISYEKKKAIISDLRQKIAENADADQSAEFAVHLADILMQNNELAKTYENNFSDYNGIRDQYMANNTIWILDQEEKRGNDRIFITGHNGHLQQYGTYTGGYQKVMGNLLSDEIGRDAYYVIGTDFYKTNCNLPTSSKKRVVRTFYSRDPLAKAAFKNGSDLCWLNFARIPEDSNLKELINAYIFMGSLGENPMDGLHGILYRILPHAYRVWQIPSKLYDGMIFVTEAHPTEIDN